MRIAAGTATRANQQFRLLGRDLTASEVCLTATRLSVGQVVAQAAVSSVDNLGGLLAHSPVGRMPFVDIIVTWLASLGTGAVAMPNGPMSTLVTLVLPVGGPVWAGIVPVTWMARCVRTAAMILTRLVRDCHLQLAAMAQQAVVVPAGAGSVGLACPPASRNVRRETRWDDGEVKMNVLIVDDSAGFREVARTLLERGGLDVVGVASNGSEALAMVETLQPQLVLLDVQLGEESGFDVARRISEGEFALPPAVVLMSTHDEIEFADLIQQSPVVGFLPKEQISAEAVLSRLSGHPSR